MRFVRVEALMGAEEISAFADGGDDGGEVLGAFGNGLVDDVVPQFAAGIERLAHGILREEPLLGAGVEVGIVDVIISFLAQDLDVEEFLNVSADTIEGRVREGRFVTVIVPRVRPLAVYLLLSDLAGTADGIHEPEVFLVLGYGHWVSV